MLLKEIIINPTDAVNNLLSRIEFVTSGEETEILVKKLRAKGMKPTITNIKLYLVRCLLVPFDELPPLERVIILRSGRPERFG
jgi:hypothetical protein